MYKHITFFAALFIGINLNSQNPWSQRLDKITLEYSKQSLNEFKDLLSIPNDAHFLSDIKKNIEWCEKAFQKRGFSTERIQTQEAPLLLASRSHPNSKKTVLIYLQVDGQPVDNKKWSQKNPYKPTLKENRNGKWEEINWNKLNGKINNDWRIYARSASDAKGPVVMFLTAMDIINDTNFKPNFNIKVIMDFEEELGSPRLPKAVLENKEKLASDMLVIFDGPRHVSNKPTLLFGARGISLITLKVFGPKVPQHSGHYGNYVPNPALKLSRLLSSMYDNQGKVVIPEWYKGIEISEDVKKQLLLVDDNESKMRKELGIAAIDNIGKTYQESIQFPSLSILGLKSAWVGKESRTIIPDSAIAELNIRLVKETKGDRMVELLKDFIKEKGFYIIRSEEPSEEERKLYQNILKFEARTFYEAFRTEFNSEIGIWLRKAMLKAFGESPVQIRISGGSIPISPFVNTLQIPAVIVPTVNKDNNQHSPNENIRLGNYLEGIKTITAILTEKL